MVKKRDVRDLPTYGWSLPYVPLAGGLLWERAGRMRACPGTAPGAWPEGQGGAAALLPLTPQRRARAGAVVVDVGGVWGGSAAEVKGETVRARGGGMKRKEGGRLGEGVASPKCLRYPRNGRASEVPSSLFRMGEIFTPGPFARSASEDVR